MAGQPPESWQSYSPPPADNQDTYGYPQPGAQSADANGGQAYARPAPGYPPQDQGYQGAQGFGMPPGYPPQDQAPPQWQAAPDMGAHPRASGDAKGFLGALFDFGFNSFVTPKIIKALYVLYTVWMIVWALIFLRLGFKYGGAAGGFFTLLVVDPIFLLLTLGAYRVVLELFMVIHKMHDDLKAIRERADERG